MKLAVSNIAWPKTCAEEHLEILREMGCEGVEVSPSMVWQDPENVGIRRARKFLSLLKNHSLCVPSLHTLTYGRSDLALFETRERREELIGFLGRICALAEMLECPLVVFGSPKSRNIPNSGTGDFNSIALESFFRIAENARKHGVTFLIEPLTCKETNFINSCSEAVSLINQIGHPSLGLHVDLRAAFEEEHNLASTLMEYRQYIRHFHVSNPDLAPPSSSCSKHRLASEAISKISYSGYLSIEMKQGFGETKSVLREAIQFIRDMYF